METPLLELLERGRLMLIQSWPFQSSIGEIAFFRLVPESRGLRSSASPIN